MKLKEYFTFSKTSTRTTTVKGSKKMAAGLGTATFRLSINKDNLKTPHYRMDKVLQMLEDRTSVNSSMDQIILFLLEDINFSSEDEKSIEFMNDWVQKRVGFREEVEQFAKLLFSCGTSYFENLYSESNRGSVLDNVFHVPDPSIIYKNMHSNDDESYWLMRVPFEVEQVGGNSARYYPFQYIRGARMFSTHIWAVALPKDKLFQKTFGWSRDGYYGSGLLGSAVDNFDIEQEILKNWALVAKYRAIGKKIIGFFNESGESIDYDELDRIKEDFMQLEEEDSLIINRKFVSEPLTFTGEDNTQDSQIEWLRKDSGSALVPNYMGAFSQDSSLATAQEAKVPFSKRLKSMQNYLVDSLNQCIVEKLRKAFPFLAEDLSFDLGTPELYSREEIFNMISQLYNMRLATMNEIRKAGGLSTVEGGDRWGEEMPLDNLSQTTTESKKRKTYLESFKIKETVLVPTTQKVNFTENFRFFDNPEKMPSVPKLADYVEGLGFEPQKKMDKFKEALKEIFVP